MDFDGKKLCFYRISIDRCYKCTYLYICIIPNYISIYINIFIYINFLTLANHNYKYNISLKFYINIFIYILNYILKSKLNQRSKFDSQFIQIKFADFDILYCSLKKLYGEV